MPGTKLLTPYRNPADPDLELTIRELHRVVNGLLRSGVISGLGGGSPSPGIDHAGLLNLDYAHAGHTNFAGTLVPNTFTDVQAVSTPRGTDTLTLHHSPGGGFGTFILCTDVLTGTVFSVLGNTGLCVSSAGFSGPGASLTGLDASQLTTGTVADARLSANVPLLNGTNAFTGGNTFSTVSPSAPGAGAGSERFGASALAAGASALALGNSASASNTDTTAVGATALASGSLSTALGYGAVASGSFSTAAGYLAAATKTNAVAVGQQAAATGQPSICVGAAATASGDNSIVIGEQASTAKRAIVLGHSGTSGFDDTLAAGNNVATRAAGQMAWSGNGSAPAFVLQHQSSTSTTRDNAALTVEDVSNTDASRKYRLKINPFDTAERDALRVEADGSRGTAQVALGGSTSFARVGGSIFDHFADAGNATTTETDLYSDTIPASALSVNGDKVEAEYGGVFVSSGTATRQVRLYFGGTAIFDTGALTLSLSAAWTMYVLIERKDSTTVRYMVSLTTEGAALAAYTAVGELGSLTLTATNILKVTGQAAGVGAASNDVVAKVGAVYFHPGA